MTKIKILSIGNYNDSFAIYEAQIMLLIGIKKQGIDITIQGNFTKEIEHLFLKNKINLIYDNPNHKIDFKFIKRLKTTIKQNHFNILHVFGNKNVSNSCFANLNSKIKIIAYFGSTSIHWYDPISYLNYLNPRVNHIITISNHINAHLRKQFLLNKNKITTIYKGYNPQWFSTTIPFDFTKIGIDKNAIIICSAGTHRPVKGMKYLMEASSYIKDKNVHLVFAGNNTDNKEMILLKNQSSIKKRIHLLGFREDIHSIIKGAHIYSQTSIDEGLGRTIIESMCLKKPIIVTNAGGCTELIEDGVNGYIAKNKNPKSIAEKINLLLESSKKRKSFGEQSYQRILDVFHIEQTVEQTISLYKKLLNK